MTSQTGLGRSAPGSPASLRTANQQRLLDVLRAGGGELPAAPLSQADLARITGLAPATVSNIVRDLVAEGLIDTIPGRGRRGTAVRISQSAGVVAGVDFGHSHLAVAVGDLTGAILAEHRADLDPTQHHALSLEQAEEMLGEVLAACERDTTEIRSVGLGLPAPIADDVVRSTAILPGWVGSNARVVAEEQFAVPVHVENDANLGALAEHRRGQGRGLDTSVFVKISSGLGAGIIIDNQLFHGTGGTAGEIGHLTLDEQGPVCRCGSRGCLEAYASVATLQQSMANQLPNASLDDIVQAANDGSIAAIRTLEDAGLHLGWGLASIVNLINPAAIIIGGDMARAGELLLGSVRIGLRRHALDAVAGTPVLASTLGERASLVGAVLLAAENVELLA